MDIIDNFNNLPIGKYLDIVKADKDETLDEFEKQVRILSVLSDIEEDEICHLPITEYKEAVRRSRFLSGLDIEGKHNICKHYRIGSWDLIPVTDIRNLETSQYCDFKTFAEDYESKIVELISTMLVPKGHRYCEGYDILALQADLRESLSVADATSLCAFFLTSFETLIRSSLNSCKSELSNLPEAEKKVMEMRLRKAEMLL